MAKRYREVKADYASYIQQQEKLKWIQYGDDNTKHFHKSIKERRSHNRINMLMIDGKHISDPPLIHKAFLSFYSNLLCCKLEHRKRIKMSIVKAGPILNSIVWSSLDLSFSAAEIKEALWSINDNKSLGLDGFNRKFYKESWSIVGTDVIAAIQEFLTSGKLLRSWNTAAITLIPKVPCPSHPGDYRPISCCHTLYNCISKLICARLRQVLGSLISSTQGAFVAGRLISHNICNTPRFSNVIN